MSFLLNFLFIIIGYVISAFGLCQIIITLRVSFPITFALKKEETNLKVSSLYVSYLITIAIWLIILSFTTFLIYNYTERIVSYLIGAIIGFLATFSQTGQTENNVNDFFATYAHRLSRNKK